MANHFIMRLQTNSQRRRVFCEQSAEWILLFLPAMCKLPIFKRSQRQRQSGCFGEDALVIAKQSRTHQHADQLLVFTAIGAIRRSVRHGKRKIIVSFSSRFNVAGGETPPTLFYRGEERVFSFGSCGFLFLSIAF